VGVTTCKLEGFIRSVFAADDVDLSDIVGLCFRIKVGGVTFEPSSAKTIVHRFNGREEPPQWESITFRLDRDLILPGGRLVDRLSYSFTLGGLVLCCKNIGGRMGELIDSGFEVEVVSLQ
jgi:hypothetical protein